MNIVGEKQYGRRRGRTPDLENLSFVLNLSFILTEMKNCWKDFNLSSHRIGRTFKNEGGEQIPVSQEWKEDFQLEGF